MNAYGSPDGFRDVVSKLRKRPADELRPAQLPDEDIQDTVRRLQAQIDELTKAVTSMMRDWEKLERAAGRR